MEFDGVDALIGGFMNLYGRYRWGKRKSTKRWVYGLFASATMS